MLILTTLYRKLLGANNFAIRSELFLCQVAVVLFFVLLLVNVVSRYFFSSPLYFAEELAVYILIWMAFFAIAATVGRNEMVRLDFLVNGAPPPIKYVINILVDLLVLICSVTLLIISFNWYLGPTIQYEQAITLGIKKLPFFTIIPLFFVLITFHSVINLAKTILASTYGHEGSEI
ncbi:TRAP transporter small permease [Halomonas sp. AOP42-C1-46]|uniref:TRAP transporter small permease n=1 Tax=Halomonas sp. AOP42-C1-46 TaxID=3457671 RepID=UPI0040345B88